AGGVRAALQHRLGHQRLGHLVSSLHVLQDSSGVRHMPGGDTAIVSSPALSEEPVADAAEVPVADIEDDREHLVQDLAGPGCITLAKERFGQPERVLAASVAQAG